MKVDVNIIKKPGVRVEVNLARGRRSGRRVSVPVRVVPYLAEDFPEAAPSEPLDASPAEELPELSNIAPAEDEAACQPDLCPEDGDAECFDEYDEGEYDDEYDECDEYDEAAEVDFYPDDEAAEETVPDEESLLRLIEEEEAEMAASGLTDRPGDELDIPGSHFMSYLDRTEDGDVYEVDGSHASGQRIVCVDSESGRISRVCGFIKHGSNTGE